MRNLVESDFGGTPGILQGIYGNSWALTGLFSNSPTGHVNSFCRPSIRKTICIHCCLTGTHRLTLEELMDTLQNHGALLVLADLVDTTTMVSWRNDWGDEGEILQVQWEQVFYLAGVLARLRKRALGSDLCNPGHVRHMRCSWRSHQALLVVMGLQSSTPCLSLFPYECSSFSIHAQNHVISGYYLSALYPRKERLVLAKALLKSVYSQCNISMSRKDHFLNKKIAFYKISPWTSMWKEGA